MSQRTEIKICGIRTAEAAEAAVEAGADYIGTVFVPGSPRLVNEAEARAVAEAVDGRAKVVALFKNIGRDFVPPDFVDVLQPYGPVPLSRLQRLAPVRIIKPLPYDQFILQDQLPMWDEQTQTMENLLAVLVDTPDPTKVGGGTGKSFDWSALRAMLDEMKLNVPIALAGGLTPDNVAEAIRVVRPALVDVSSGVESQRGVKDPAKIRDFCQAARQASA